MRILFELFNKGCIITQNVKLPAHRAGLPGKVLSLHIVPLYPAYKAGLVEHLPANGLQN